MIPNRPLPEGRWVSATATDDIGIAAADVAAGVAVRLARPIGLMVDCSEGPRIVDVYHGELTGETRYLDEKPEEGGPRPVAEVRPPRLPFGGGRTLWVLLEELSVVDRPWWAESQKQRRRREAGTRD